MNAYLILDESGHKVWIAETMFEALEQHWRAYLAELIGDGEQDDTEEQDRDYYELEILQSCSLVGEVGVPAT